MTKQQMSRRLLLLLLCAFVLPAQTVPPKCIRKVAPQYSQTARAKTTQGLVRMSLDIDVEGKPINIQVTDGLGDGLDEKAVECVSQWRFIPGTRNGKAAQLHVTIEIGFRL